MKKGYQHQISMLQEQRKALADELCKMDERIKTCNATMTTAEQAFEDAKKVVEDRKKDRAEKQRKLAALDNQIADVQCNLEQYVKTKDEAVALYNADPSNNDHAARLIAILTAEYQHALEKLEKCKTYAAEGAYDTKAEYLRKLERRGTAVAESSNVLMKVYQRLEIGMPSPAPMHVEQQFDFHGIHCTEDNLIALLGALTGSVRDDWGDPNDRLDLISEICSVLDEEGWGSVVTAFWKNDDGRVFRDTNSGIPYGNVLEKENPLYDQYHSVVCYECRTGNAKCSD